MITNDYETFTTYYDVYGKVSFLIATMPRPVNPAEQACIVPGCLCQITHYRVYTVAVQGY